MKKHWQHHLEHLPCQTKKGTATDTQNRRLFLGPASASPWCKHFCSSQAKMCLLRSALSSALGVPLQDGKTHPGHLPKSSCFSGRQGPFLGSPSLPQEGSGKSAQQPSTSRCALLVWPFKLHYTIAEVCRKAAETRLAWKNVLAKVWNNPPILNLLGVHTAVACQDSRRIRVTSVRQGNQRECCKQGLHTGNLEETIQREDREEDLLRPDAVCSAVGWLQLSISIPEPCLRILHSQPRQPHLSRCLFF